MAKVTITIEDLPGSKVKIVAEPSFEMLAKMDVSGNALTSAQGYAMYAMKKIREASKQMGPTQIFIPRKRSW